MPSSVRTAYRDRLKAGEIQPDAAQERAVEALSRLEADVTWLDRCEEQLRVNDSTARSNR